jgi:predicted RNase H-like HicB family nuclease
MPVELGVEVEREDDGRWIAEIVDLPGVLAYGKTRANAITAAQALVLRVLADRLEHDESAGTLLNVSFVASDQH